MRGPCCYQAMSKLIIVKSMVGVILCICVLCNYTKAQPEDGHYQAPKHTACSVITRRNTETFRSGT